MNKDKIVFRLIPKNQYALVSMYAPCRQLDDVAIAYYELGDDNIASLITNKMMKSMESDEELTEENLYELAYENTKRIFPPQVKSMDKVIRELGVEPGDHGKKMFVVSNANKVYGAINMIYPECLEQVSEMLGDDLYIMPSSLHETIMIGKKDAGDVLDLQDVVHEINIMSVHPSERLSNQLFCYNRDTKELALVHTGRYLDLELDHFEGEEEEPDFETEEEKDLEMVCS